MTFRYSGDTTTMMANALDEVNRVDAQSVELRPTYLLKMATP